MINTASPPGSMSVTKVLATRKNIACVLVNPLQGLHPNSGAPSDNMLVDSSRKGHFDREAYGAWLRRLAEVCRKAGIAEATFYNWRKRYAGLMPSEVKRLRQLEEENAKLKRIVADLSLDKAMLQDVLSKKV